MHESNNRNKLLERLTDLICAVARPHPVRVAIDGVDASGKTTMANELAPLIEKRGRPFIRASVDGFHNPKEVRYQRGQDSPEGYYLDSFNYEILQRDLLIPLGPDGKRQYRRATFNFREDAATPETWEEAPVNAILLFDGVFLLRPELIQHWDFSVFVDVDFDASVPRAVARDVGQSKGQLNPETALAKYNRRYVPGQRIYLAQACPTEHANAILQNNNLKTPKLIIP
jgi:uridine kinase